jgi:hypothetical protein
VKGRRRGDVMYPTAKVACLILTVSGMASPPAGDKAIDVERSTITVHVSKPAFSLLPGRLLFRSTGANISRAIEAAGLLGCWSS